MHDASEYEVFDIETGRRGVLLLPETAEPSGAWLTRWDGDAGSTFVDPATLTASEPAAYRRVWGTDPPSLATPLTSERSPS